MWSTGIQAQPPCGRMIDEEKKENFAGKHFSGKKGGKKDFFVTINISFRKA